MLCIGGMIVFLRSPTQPDLVVATLLPTPTPYPVQVYVSGAVNNPDVYELPAATVGKTIPFELTLPILTHRILA
jgi:protein involved in polysaccharide export with SLBB domain